jgi:hypothetical protein
MKNCETIAGRLNAKHALNIQQLVGLFQPKNITKPALTQPVSQCSAKPLASYGDFVYSIGTINGHGLIAKGRCEKFL